jgi:hypothetical protein
VMAIFRQRFAIESPLPIDEARKKLLAVVKTGLPKCAKCGEMLAGAGALFCSSCGQAVSRDAPPRQPWLQRAFSSRKGFEFEGINARCAGASSWRRLRISSALAASRRCCACESEWC